MEDHRHNSYSSFFWPVLLIGVGVIWLLKNFGMISGVNFSVLFRLWPLFLIVIGLDLLFGRRSPVLGALIGLVTAGVAIAVILISPVTNVELSHDTFSASAAGVEQARIDLGLSVGTANVSALSDSSNLIEADLTYLGEIEFDEQGQGNKHVTLKQRSGGFDINLFDSIDIAERLQWDIRLSRNTPLDLSIEGSVGRTNLDLSDLELTNLVINGGVGETIVQLPAEKFEAVINGDVGNFNVNIPDGAGVKADIAGDVGGFTVKIEEGAAVDMKARGGVGNFVIDVPDDAAVRLDAKMDLGNITMPGNFRKLSGNQDGPSREGIWQTSNYDGADRKIIIEFDGDIGNLTVK